MICEQNVILALIFGVSAVAFSRQRWYNFFDKFVSESMRCIMEKWLEQHKNIQERYCSRNEIEEIVKKCSIDRSRFYEYSKNDYTKILKKFYYSFVDYKKFPNFHLNYVWLNFRDNLKKVYSQFDWEKALDGIKQYFDRIGSRKLFLILSDGWVYEGYINEIISVVSEIDGTTIEDFYIVSPKFDSFAMFCSDGDCFNIFEA